MAQHSSSFDALIERFITERLKDDEIPLFFSFLEEEGFRLRYAERIELDLLEEAFLGWSHEQQADRLYKNILDAGNITASEKPVAPIWSDTSRRSFKFSDYLHPNRWLRYAAAILVLFSGAAIYYYMGKKEIPVDSHVQAPVVFLQEDVPPGGNRAMLILGDKSVVALDSLANGTTMFQGNMQIIKSDDGQINYVPLNASGANDAVVTNTVKTPRGGQYQLTLSDGTQVWLNAASSITYPTRFEGDHRTVNVSGEVYFEVARNKEMPFVVNINGTDKVEVLGTHFNVNAYEDESAIKTTLLEGRVKVISGDASVVLLPGQQSTGTQVSANADLVQVMAWKNGIFSFEGKSLQQVLRELARWYDLTITYEKNIPDVKLRGEMGMNLNLSQVIKGLRSMDVNCHLQAGNQLVVLP